MRPGTGRSPPRSRAAGTAPRPRTPASPSVGQQYPPVRGGERLAAAVAARAPGSWCESQHGAGAGAARGRQPAPAPGPRRGARQRGRADGGVLLAEQRAPALALHGSSSASSSSHDVPSSANSPAVAAAPAPVRGPATRSAPARRTAARSWSTRAPGAGATPNRAAAAPEANPQTSTTAREPMCSSSQTTSSTPSRGRRERLVRVLEQVSVAGVATGLIVGGRYTSQRGSIANRLITSSAAAACAAAGPDPGRDTPSRPPGCRARR